MSAPLIWIGVPLAAAVLIGLSRSPRTAAIQGATTAALLAVLAWLIPIDTAMVAGPVSVKIAASVQVLGRSLSFSQPDGPLLAFIYGSSALWFFGSFPAGGSRQFIPLGLAIVSLLVASLAVEPFLFAALLIEIAAMLAVPLMILPGSKPGNGVLRFITYQTLSMPFILLSGWMLAGVEASPSDIAMTTQAAVMLGLGFAFLLSIFPLYSWIPMLAEETSAYVLGFMLWTLPVFSMVFAMGFMDRYAWLRTSPQLSSGIAVAATVMVASAGWFAAFQRHLGRMMALVAVAETGLSLLALSLGSAGSLELTFMLLLPRGIELALWALALAVLSERVPSLALKDVEGLARRFPVATGAVVVANLSMAGLPLLAGFPPRLALAHELTLEPGGLGLLVVIGLGGSFVAALRSLAAFVKGPPKTRWAVGETNMQVFLLGTAMLVLLLLGLVPQLLQPFLSTLPRLFEHLASLFSML